RYYDGRYRDYNTYLNDPYYFDPYRRNISYQYANSYIPGLYDLDYYGDWQNLDGYGYAWCPRGVDSGWMPYQSGYWMTDYPYGPTWVSNEPWGYAPYHYGRWAFVGDRWYWVPDNVRSTPVYSPALVAFMPFGSNDIGWVPLGPGDVYVPHYYNTSWQPYYLTRDSLYNRVVNLDVPGAVTVVGVDDFWRGTDWRRARKADRNSLASVNPVLDPLLLTPLRNAVVNSAWGRGKKDIPPGIARKLQDTTVITSVAPVAPAFARDRDVARALRVEQVSDRAKGQKFKVRDERQGRGAQQAANGSRAEQPRVEPERGGGPPARDERGGRVERGGGPPDRNERGGGAPARVERERGGPPARAERGGPPARAAQPDRRPQNNARPVQQQRPQAERAARPVQQPRQQQRPVQQQRPQAERVSRPVERPQQQQQKAQPQQRQQAPAKAAPAKGRGGGKGKKP
ncbi:MAG TPA: DUF6600 domain-containing protein, partial [Pyrinomonadaceae bacterium]|nr:DUF6600 domain-containing protein [Pyrinomonadaceae bacterium]